MRATVAHLTRNIRIVCQEVDNWGGRVLVTKFFDFANLILFSGTVDLYGVEIAKFGRKDTDMAALDFRLANGN
jgi:hypothetical protein